MGWEQEARRHRERRGDATNRPPGHLHLQPAAPPWNDTEMWGAVTWASVTAWHRVTSRVSTPAPARVSRPAPPAAALTNLSSGPQSPLHRPAERMSRHSAWHVTPPRDLVTVILSPQPQWRRMRHSILATKKPLRILTEWEVCVSGELRRTFSFYRIIIWEKESINSTLVPLMYKFKLKTENWQCKLAQATLSVLYVLMVSYKNPAFSYTYHIISMRR